MRITLILLVFWLAAPHLMAQRAVSVSYLGHGLIWPGIKAGLKLPLKTWESQKTRKDLEISKEKQLFIKPSIGVFTRPRFYSSTLVNVATGWQQGKSTSKYSSAFSLGMGFLAQNEVISLRTNFKGDITEKTKELRGYFLPSFNYSIHRKLSESLAVYTLYSYGMKFSPTRARSAVFFIEAGLSYSLSSKTNTND